ncbi:uncharacterized protein EDB91DRAFT_479185 [Suillus paluster]|uniref:uncharacterized protein n=1 Tax=Suillus paluster TaxID=48578 RepID=UPI001B8656CB|nr:uncharacterized protein EDB91DRAFT_479185 [Suillus paluster]KAG1737491.1 hypothetical protein EDB91DRAFT_479185 [Suillus paluster]
MTLRKQTCRNSGDLASDASTAFNVYFGHASYSRTTNCVSPNLGRRTFPIHLHLYNLAGTLNCFSDVGLVMSDAGSCLGSLCGGCCIVLTTAPAAWCSTSSFSVLTSNYCCRGCCRDSFNEHHFDEQIRKEMERTKDSSQLVETQPGPSGSMTANMTENTSGGPNH